MAAAKEIRSLEDLASITIRQRHQIVEIADRKPTDRVIKAQQEYASAH